MSGLLAYSGIATKVKSMQSKLLSEDKLREMAALENVPEALEYLKRQPAYEDLFSDVDDQSFHRSAIEQRLLLSKYRVSRSFTVFPEFPSGSFWIFIFCIMRSPY